MENDIKATSVIICDDIRREPSGKEMLIGVYAGVILFPRLPAIMNVFSTRIEFETSLKHADDLKVELMDSEGNSLFSITGSMEMVGRDGKQVLSVVTNGVEFKTAGTHTLYFGRKDNMQPIYQFPIRIDLLLGE